MFLRCSLLVFLASCVLAASESLESSEPESTLASESLVFTKFDKSTLDFISSESQLSPSIVKENTGGFNESELSVYDSGIFELNGSLDAANSNVSSSTSLSVEQSSLLCEILVLEIMLTVSILHETNDDTINILADHMLPNNDATTHQILKDSSVLKTLEEVEIVDDINSHEKVKPLESVDKVEEVETVKTENTKTAMPEDIKTVDLHEESDILNQTVLAVLNKEGLLDVDEDTEIIVSKAYEQVKHINLTNISNIDLSDEDGDGTADNTTDDCRFMSFEEWKKQKNLEDLAKASSESQDNALKSVVNKALQVIDLNKPEVKPEVLEDEGRTYKDKFNYASADCAATIVSTNSDAKGASAILKEIKDSYLLNKCSTPNKFVVIELCQDILVNHVVMGNFELFSSMFKSVKFSVSESFPVTTEWKELGVFEADNIRDLQTFDIENPLIWARYLRIDILSHYGSEFYCPISLVRVHGTSMIEEFKGVNGNTPSEVEEKPISTENFLNYTSEFSREEDECRVVLPYLELNEFLKDINGTNEYCLVPTIEESTMSAESTGVKTTQESILKNIVNRLSLLESNASLSLLYVEEQSKLLSNAFTNLEKRHASKFDSLIQKLNQTVVAQVAFLEATLGAIKSESKQLLQNHESWTSNLLASVDDKNYRLMRELSFQRTIIAIDTLLILALLAYVIITREFLISEEAPLDVDETITKRTKPIKQFFVHSSKKPKSQRKRRGRS